MVCRQGGGHGLSGKREAGDTGRTDGSVSAYRTGATGSAGACLHGTGASFGEWSNAPGREIGGIRGALLLQGYRK